MWDSLLDSIPEKRLPSAFNILAFLSVTLPLLAGMTAFAAWKLGDRISKVHDRIGKSPVMANPAPVVIAAPASVPEDKAANAALLEAQSALKQNTLALQQSETLRQKSEQALRQVQEDLRQAEARAQAATEKVAHATDRRITPIQRQKFLDVCSRRPKGRVGITTIIGDAEGRAYADQLADLLTEAGFDVSDEFGTINLNGGSLVGVRVGAFSKDAAPPYALPLAASLIDSDIPAFPVVNQRVAAGAVDITVGTNPAAATSDGVLPPESPVSPTPPASGATKAASPTTKAPALKSASPKQTPKVTRPKQP